MPKSLFSKSLLIFASFFSANATTLSLSTSANPASFGQLLTLSATVSPANASGKVTFYEGSNLLGTASVNSGTASFQTNLLPSGTRFLQARFTGNNSTATSAVVAQTINSAPANNFTAPTKLATADTPKQIVNADFNGDGKQDFAVSSVSGVQIFLGNGDGTFQAPATLAYGSSSRIAVADFNGDGKTDIFVVSGGSGYVLLGNGDGTFQAGVSYSLGFPSGSIVSAVAIGDFNGDGKADVAAIASDNQATSSGILSILPGKGDGTLQSPIATATTSYPNAIAVGDFNGDGNADVVISSGLANHFVSLFLGKGDGTFQPTGGSPIASLVHPAWLAAADLNADGKLDLAVADSSTGIIVILGNGDGTFAAPVSYGPSARPQGLAIGDINGDGKPDLAIADPNRYGAGVLLGNGDGTFQAPVFYYTGYSPLALVIGEFNGDSRADLAVVNANTTLQGDPAGNSKDPSASVGLLFGISQSPGALTSSTTIRTLFNPTAARNSVFFTVNVFPSNATGTVTFGMNGVPLGTATIAGGGANFSTPRLDAGSYVLTADYSGDSAFTASSAAPLAQTVAKIPTATYLAVSPSSPTVGQSVLLRATVFPATKSVTSLTGTVTFLDYGSPVGSPVAVSSGIAVYIASLASGTHRFTATYSGETNYSASVSAIVNQFVYTSRTATSTTLASGKSAPYLGQATVLTASVTSGTGNVTFYDGPIVLGTSKLNQGVATLATSTLATGKHNLIAYYAGDSLNSPSTSTPLPLSVTSIAGAGFAPAVNYAVSQNPYGVVTADFNRDGKLDIAVANATGGNVSILLGKGDGTFQAAINTAIGISPRSIAVADLNADGIPDLAVTIAGGNAFAILLGNGDGSFQSSVPYAAPGNINSSAGPIAIADFNGDGIPDIVCATALGSQTIYLGVGDGTFALATSSTADGGSLSTYVIATGDFNRDGFVDVIILGSTAMEVQLGNGDGTLQQSKAILTSGAGFIRAPLLLADFDGDGLLDLSYSYNGNQLIALGKGDGTFSTPISSTGPTNMAYATVGDFNGDGFLDFAATTYSGGVAVLYGNGTGSLQPAYGYPTGSGYYTLAVGDFNGDGRADIVVPNYADNTVSILLATAPQQSILFPPLPAKLLSVGTTTITATATSALPVTFTANSLAVCTVASSTVTLLTTGTCSITATQPGNTTYAAATPVTRSFNITSTATAVLGIALSHTGNFAQSQVGATYTVTVTNLGTAATTGQVAATVTLPTGLTATSTTGTGWACNSTCSRTDALAANASYPPITVTVTVAANATTPLIAQAQVTGGASATDPTTIVSALTDTTPTDYFFPAVNLLREYNITAGCGTNIYCPNDNVTRAQMAIFIVRTALGGDNFISSALPYFNDVTPTTFGFKWIQKMYELGITAGCGGGNYCPNDNITRGQMAVFVIRARLGAAADSTFTYPITPTFNDVPANALYFKWIQRMAADQITAGCGGGNYCPNDPVTRGQMAIFLMRGGFSQLLPTGTPTLLSATPATVPLNQIITIQLTGANTTFVQGTTTVQAGPGITVGTITVIDSLNLTVQLTAAPAATLGKRTVVVSTNTEQAVLPNGLTIQ